MVFPPSLTFGEKRGMQRNWQAFLMIRFAKRM